MNSYTFISSPATVSNPSEGKSGKYSPLGAPIWPTANLRT